jgi:hypothetical protein
LEVPAAYIFCPDDAGSRSFGDFSAYPTNCTVSAQKTVFFGKLRCIVKQAGNSWYRVH